jgi:hypothetical protein
MAVVRRGSEIGILGIGLDTLDDNPKAECGRHFQNLWHNRHRYGTRTNAVSERPVQLVKSWRYARLE